MTRYRVRFGPYPGHPVHAETVFASAPAEAARDVLVDVYHESGYARARRNPRYRWCAVTDQITGVVVAGPTAWFLEDS